MTDETTRTVQEPAKQRSKVDAARPAPFLSRVQLKIRASETGLTLENVGRVALRDDAGREVMTTTGAPGSRTVTS